jgi:hypothetical protein
MNDQITLAAQKTSTNDTARTTTLALRDCMTDLEAQAASLGYFLIEGSEEVNLAKRQVVIRADSDTSAEERHEVWVVTMVTVRAQRIDP